MRILILGGTGFMGGPVARRLLAEGHAVTVLHRGRTAGDLPREIAHIEGERTQPRRHARCIRDGGARTSCST